MMLILVLQTAVRSCENQGIENMSGEARGNDWKDIPLIRSLV